MKHPLFALCLLAVLFCWNCSDKKEKKKPAPEPTHTLVFLDKTASVDVAKPFVADKYQRAVRALIDESVHQQGDKVEVYYVHENTAKARSLSLTARTERESFEEMNDTDAEAARTTYDMAIRRERGIMANQVIKKLMTPNTGDSNRETNVSASIPIMAEALANGMEVNAYFFSDMVESLAAGRDFHKMPPASAAQAAEWAKADAKKLADYSLAGARIKMILPFEPTSSSKENNPHVTAYWKLLLEELGASDVSEE